MNTSSHYETILNTNLVWNADITELTISSPDQRGKHKFKLPIFHIQGMVTEKKSRGSTKLNKARSSLWIIKQILLNNEDSVARKKELHCEIRLKLNLWNEYDKKVDLPSATSQIKKNDSISSCNFRFALLIEEQYERKTKQNFNKRYHAILSFFLSIKHFKDAWGYQNLII